MKPVVRQPVKEALKRREQDEDDYWDRRINVAHRQINRKKYYGVGVEIESYKDQAEESVDISRALNILKARDEDVSRGYSEDLADDIAEAVVVKGLTGDNRAAIAGIFSDSFEKGTRRLFTKEGDRVDVDSFVDQSVINAVMTQQKDYWNNMASDLKDTVRNTVREGVEEGKGIDKIARDLDNKASSFTRSRSETIARSEVIKASSKGTQSTMEKAGIDEFMWLSARNSDVCKGVDAGASPSFETNINGTTYTSCRELDGEVFNRQGIHPVPVKDSHPNCRCTLVANTE